MSYADFIARKTRGFHASGFEPDSLMDALFPFQKQLVSAALARGRSAMFADTGLGKTVMQLEWARQVHERTGGKVLVLSPLAVGRQTVREAARFGISAAHVAETTDDAIQITNYQKLHRLDTDEYVGVVLDESSILKSLDGKTKTMLIESFKNTPHRLACTATPAPNDYTELGSHAEFLGVCRRSEMLANYFINDGGTSNSWRIKRHAVKPFWKWVKTWADLVRHPRDLGDSTPGYDLPELRYVDHVIPATREDAAGQGLLMALPALTLSEQRAARRSSMDARVAKLAEVVDAEPEHQWLVWCDMNDESHAAAKAIGAVEVKGGDTDEHKERSMLGFTDGSVARLVTKPSIAGFGMNWQQCSRIAFLGVSHSFERFYQAVRRCWRFGAIENVHCHIITSELEGAVVINLKKKQASWEAMMQEVGNAD